MPRRKLILVATALVLLLMVGGAGVAWWVVHEKVADIHNGASAPFTLTSDPTTTAAPRPTLAARYGPDWPIYGYNLARTRNASDLTMIHPPYRVVWKTGQLGILEYPPSYRRGVLYLTTDAGWAAARSLFTRQGIWRRRLQPPLAEPT